MSKDVRDPAALEAALARAREQQSAVAAVMRTMSATPTDLEATLDAILSAATRLCHATQGYVYVLDGDLYRITRTVGIDQAFDAWAREHPIPVGDPGKATSRAALLGGPLHIPDVLKDPKYTFTEAQQRGNFRTILCVPLMKDGVAVAVISMWRTVQKPFSDEEIGLVSTFADQALIAFESVRLASETKEALEQQTATGEVLRAISNARDDVRPVLQTIVDQACRLCAAEHAGFWMAHGQAATLEAVAGAWAGAGVGSHIPVFADVGLAGLAFVQKRTLHEADARAGPRDAGDMEWRRTRLAVPVLQDGSVVGVIRLGRSAPGGFTARQIDVVESFARQAAIAMQNVRLFNETKQSLEQQTATADLLKVVSRATSDLKPVFDTIIESAVRVCHADYATFWRPDGDAFVVVAGTAVDPSFLGFLRTTRVRPERGSVTGRALLERTVVHLPDVFADPEIGYRHAPRPGGARSALGIPILRGDVVIAVLAVGRNEVRPFSSTEIAIAQTFADQAAIAIENVRLFNETKESLARQTAISEILRAMAASPTDERPVLDAIARSAVRFCGAQDAAVALRGESTYHFVAHEGDLLPDFGTERPLDESTVSGRVIVRGELVSVADIQQLADEFPRSVEFAKKSGQRAMVSAPMLRQGRAIGAIVLRRRDPKSFTPAEIELLRAFADQAVIAIENVRLFNETKASLERQTATAEILQVISSSPTDITPVFEAIARSAARYCDATNASVALVEGDMFHIVGHTGDVASDPEPRPLSGAYLTARAIRERRTLHTADLQTATEYPEGAEIARRAGYRAIAVAPMVRGDRAVGSVTLRRATAQPFSARQIELLETFAAQAGIAVENVRLFNETQESLEQQRAIGDILRVISESPTDIQPVLDAIARSATRYCGAEDCGVALVRADGMLEQVAQHGPISRALVPWPVDRGSVRGRAVVDRRVVHVEDMLAEPQGEYAIGKQRARELGQRTILAAPLLREGVALGAIALRRTEVKPFSEKQIDLLRTFADQAAIAIENVRLFNETKAALEQQTAVGDVLKTISRTAFDLQAVFDVVVDNAKQLCRGDFGYLFRHDGDVFRIVASSGGTEALLDAERRNPTPLDPNTLIGRTALTRATVHIPDFFTEPGYSYKPNIEFGVHTGLAVPIFGGGEVVAAIGVARFAVDPFSAEEIRLVETFADQAAIAMENARLFGETKESLEQQTAVAGVLEAINAAAFDQQPVLQELVDRAARLCDATFSSISLWDGQVYVTKAWSGPGIPAQYVEQMVEERRAPERGSLIGRTALERRTVHIVDVLQDSAYEASDMQRAAGYRSMLGVPLMREDFPVGIFALTRNEVKPFSERQIQLVETFAKQAVIAIENVRLFNETKESLDQQTAVGEVLTAISRSAFDLGPVLQTVIDNAVRLSGADNGSIVRDLDGNVWTQVAHAGRFVDKDAYVRAAAGRQMVPGRKSATGRVLAEKRSIQIDDIQTDPDYERFPEQHAASGARAILGVPLIRENVVIGVILLRRWTPGLFTETQVAVVETFAAQAVIAIENVRLFNETKESLEQQTAIADILRVISASPTDTQPVLDAIAASATKFAAAEDAAVLLVRDGALIPVSHHGPIPMPLSVPVDRDSVSGHATIEVRTIHAADVTATDEYPRSKSAGVQDGQRTVLAAPLVREGQAVGVIVLRRRESRPFTDRQVQLAETFAGQAAIAIENVRLFNETRESLEQQTAISDVLNTISRSAFDLERILKTVVENAARLCDADLAWMTRLEGDSYVHQLGARYVRGPELAAADEFLRQRGGRRLWPLTTKSVMAAAYRAGATIRVEDIRLDPELAESGAALNTGSRSVIAVPVAAEGRMLGAIALARVTVKPFTERESQLVQTFADQAAIAIQNARLLNETKEALERQTATAEVLKVISGTAFDLPRVLDTVISHATRLTDAEAGFVYQVDGELLRMSAAFGEKAEVMRDWQREHPIRTDYTGSSTGRAFTERRTAHIPDVLADPTYTYKEAQQLGNFRTLLSVPLLQDDQAIGVIALWRTVTRPFTAEQIALVESFADQAVIAIQNVHLFDETKQALARQTASSDVLRTIATTTSDVTPVFDSICSSAARLSDSDWAWFLVAGRPHGAASFFGELDPFTRASLPSSGATFTVPARAEAKRTVEWGPEEIQDRAPIARHIGARRLLLVYLYHGDTALGQICIARRSDRPFSAGEKELLAGFADQAQIAIRNVRLFNETKEALEQQTAVSEVLKTISRTVFDLEPTLQTVVENAARLVDADVAWMTARLSQEGFTTSARYGRTPELLALFGERAGTVLGPVAFPRSIMGRVYREGRSVHIPDTQLEPELTEASPTIKRTAARTALAVPVMSEGEVIAGLIVARLDVHPFNEREIQLVGTFADQAAIAIQNVRLFNDVQRKGRELEVANRHKSEFLANMSHELRTPLNAIIGFSEVLLQGIFGDVNEKQREYLDDVLSSGKHLLLLINDILDLSKIEAGRMELELTTFSLAPALDSALTIVRERAARHGITLRASVPPDLPPVEADERKVKQILFNLLSNAVKFTADGGRVDVRVRAENGDVRVDVQDTGIGIAPEDHGRVFEEFQQVGRERSREGTGLGLTLSKRFVQLHGGRIWLESTPGKGSTFSFTLPLRRPAEVKA